MSHYEEEEVPVEFVSTTLRKTWTHIVDEKQVGIMPAITVISSSNASQKL